MAVIKDKKCMIIGAAPLASGAVFEEFDPKEHYVICADAGYDTAVQYGVRPDLVIGDFDSAAKRPPETIRTIKLPVEKDVTDMMGAVMVGQKLGYKTFVLIGGLGGDRFDHSMANLDVLLYISKHGGSAVLCTEDTKVFVVRCGCTIELKKVYRQNDGTFLELLNRIRENRCDGQVLEALNRR